jgi:hypothetical protein
MSEFTTSELYIISRLAEKGYNLTADMLPLRRWLELAVAIDSRDYSHGKVPGFVLTTKIQLLLVDAGLMTDDGFVTWVKEARGLAV